MVKDFIIAFCRSTVSEDEEEEEPGLPDFSWGMMSKLEKIYQTNTKCTK
jgi:hypothetical protein